MEQAMLESIWTMFSNYDDEDEDIDEQEEDDEPSYR